MNDHIAPSVIEELALGPSEPGDQVIAHLSACDACAEKLAREARLELALGELHAFRAGDRHVRKTPALLRLAPVLVIAAAAAIFLVVRQPRPTLDVHAEPAPVRAPGQASPPANSESVISSLRPRLKKCLTAAIGGGAVDGKVVLVAAIAEDGSVRDVTVDSNTGIPAETVSCLANVVRGAHFQASNEPTTLRVPISFTAR